MEQYPELKKALLAYRDLIIERKIPNNIAENDRRFLHSMRTNDFWNARDAKRVLETLKPHKVVLRRVKGINVAELPAITLNNEKGSSSFLEKSNLRLISYSEDFIVSFPYDGMIVEAIKGIPSAKYDPNHRVWHVPITSSKELKKFSLRFGFNIGDSALIVLNNVERNLSDSYSAELVELNLPLKMSLYPFQTGGASYAIRNRRVVIADQMGLGKTPQSIATVEGIHQKELAFPALVVCPKSLRQNWKAEWNMWTSRSVQIIDKKLMKQFDRYMELGICEVGIVNYDGLKTHFVERIIETLTSKRTNATEGKRLKGARKELRERYNEFRERVENKQLTEDQIAEMNLAFASEIKACKMTITKKVIMSPGINHFKTIILDEAHECRNRKTLKFKVARAAAMGKQNRIALTGTPIVTGPGDLASLLEIIGRIEDFGGHYKFNKVYSGLNTSGLSSGRAQPQNLKALNQKLRSLCFIRREKFQVLKELPDKFRQIIKVEIDNQREYDHAYNFFIDYLQSQNLEQDKIDRAMRAQMLVQINKLKQISAKGKLSAVKNFVEEVVGSGEKLVVFCWFLDTAQFIKDNFDGVVSITGRDTDDEIQANKKAFQEGSAKIIVCTYQKAYAGHTLTAASKFLSIELPWTYSFAAQAEDRIHRIGQKRSAECFYFLGVDTIDEQIYEIIEDRRKMEVEATDGQEQIPTKVFEELASAFIQKSRK